MIAATAAWRARHRQTVRCRPRCRRLASRPAPTATWRRAWPAPPAASRPTTRCRSWRTPPWSRRLALPRSGPADRNLGSFAGCHDCSRHRGGRLPAFRTTKSSSTHDARRRFRPARRDPGIRPRGGAHRQGSRSAGQAGLDARRGCQARFLRPVGDGALDRRPRRRRHADRLEDAARRPVFRFRHRAAFGNSFIDRASSQRLTNEMPYDVPNYLVDYVVCQIAGADRGVARDQLHAERLLQGMLRRRDGARRWNGPLSLPAAPTAQQPQKSRRARCRGEEGGLVRAAAAGRVTAASRSTRPAAVIAPKWSKPRSRRRSVRVHRVVVAIDCGHVVNPLSVEMQVQGAVVFALTAALLWRDHHQGRRRRAMETSTITKCCASPTRRRSKP